MKKEIVFAMRSTAAVVFALLALPSASYGQNARQQIEQKITETTRNIEAIKSSDELWKQLAPFLTHSLTRSEKAAQADRLFAALEYLESARTNLQGAEALGVRATVAQRGMDGYSAESDKTDQYLKVQEQHYAEGDWSTKPVALRALAEASQARTRALFDSGRGFAVATGPQDGLFYLGQARGTIDFALFCQTLRLKTDLPAPPLRSMAAEIHLLEDQILAVYKPPRSVEQHPQFIRINSTLKEASDLEAAHLKAGALYKYLEAVGLFAALDAPVPGSDKAQEIREELSRMRRQLAGEKFDHSIAEIFLQHAEEGLDPAQSKDDYGKGLQRAQIILGRVMPAYFKALGKPPDIPSAPAHVITVTLVRWPYT